MTLIDLMERPEFTGDSLPARMARFFLAHEGQPIRHRELSAEFGCGGWRTRLSELRHAPWFMDIQNHQWNVYDLSGKRYRMSSYTYHGLSTVDIKVHV